MSIIAVPRTFHRFLSAGMLTAVSVGFGTGVVTSGVLLRMDGVEGMSERMLSLTPQNITILIAIGILTSATLGGFHSAASQWKDAGVRMIVTLFVGMLIRFVGILMAERLFGIPGAVLLAAGFMATDPVGTEIAIGLSKREGPSHLDTLMWLLATESFLNDAGAIAAFSVAAGENLFHTIVVILLTILVAIVLGFADAGARFAIRVWLVGERWRRYEALVEFGFVFLFTYPLIYIVGSQANLSPILMGALGAILADLIIHRIVHERGYRKNEKVRKHLSDLFTEIGMGLVVFIATFLMPWRAFWNHPTYLVRGFVILSCILFARVTWVVIEMAWYLAVGPYLLRLCMRYPQHSFACRAAAVVQLYGPRPLWVLGEELISVSASCFLLGVPTVVSVELYHMGYHSTSIQGFALIFVSWVSVFVTVPLIQKIDRRLERMYPRVRVRRTWRQLRLAEGKSFNENGHLVEEHALTHS